MKTLQEFLSESEDDYQDLINHHTKRSIHHRSMADDLHRSIGTIKGFNSHDIEDSHEDAYGYHKMAAEHYQKALDARNNKDSETENKAKQFAKNMGNKARQIEGIFSLK